MYFGYVELGRFLKFSILSSLILSFSGCLYYGDIHGQAMPLTITDLSSNQIENTHPLDVNKPIAIQSLNWWEKFHDQDLNQLINVALMHSPDLHMAEARVRQANQLVTGAAAPLWPTLDFSGYVQREKFSEFGLIPPPFNGETYNIGDAGINFNYEFDFWGKNKHALIAALDENCARQADLNEAKLILSAAVAKTYFQLLANIAEVSLAKEIVSKSEKLCNIARQHAKHGIQSDIPVQTAYGNVQTSRLSLEQLKQTELLTRNKLAVLLGKNPLAVQMSMHAFVYRPHKILLSPAVTAHVLINRPDLYAAKMRTEAARQRIHVAIAGFFPDINLNALFSYQSVGLGHLFNVVSQNNAITGAVDLPIFDAGARRANLGVKYAEYDLAVESYNQTILTALCEVADQQVILRAVNAEMKAENSLIKTLQHNYKLFSSRYNHGITDYTQLLEIQLLLLQQKMIGINLQARDTLATIALLKALGGTDS